jgi:hypothetical protein
MATITANHATAVNTRRRPTWPSVAQLTLALLLLGLAWRVLLYALGFPIWGDEAFVAVDFVVRDYRDMIQPSVYGQIVPIVFLWAELAISRVLGLSEWSLHLLPTLAGIAALLLFWRFARRTLPRRPALLAIGIFAASFYIVRHGAEVKPYITDLLVSLGFTMLAWAVYERPRSAWRWIALNLFAGAAVWCSYPAAFVGGAAGLLLTWLVWRKRFRPGILAGWLVFGVVLCGSFLAMYVTVGRAHAEFAARLTTTWAAAFPPLTEPWKLPLWLCMVHTGLMFAYPHGGTAPGSIVTFLCVVVGAVRLARTRPALLFLLLGPLPLAFMAAAGHAYPYGESARTMLYMAPALCLLAGLGLFVAVEFLVPRGVALVSRRPAHRAAAIRRVLVGVTAALALMMIGIMIGQVLWPYQSLPSFNSREAVRAAARQTAPGDRWVVFNADKRVSYAPFLGDWRGVGGQFVFDALRFAPSSVAWAPPPETIDRAPGGRVWLLAYQAESTSKRKPLDFPHEQLDAYVAVLAERLGPPQHASYPIKNERGKVETLEVYRFGS